MKVSVVIPCYNEINYIETVIENIKLKNQNLDMEIIVIDDASKDGTQELVNKLKYEKKNR